MQITPINLNYSFKSAKTNRERIDKLTSERAAIQWASEGCTGSLDDEKEKELALRLELDKLACEHEAFRWASEGCNSSLSPEKERRLEALQNLFADDDVEEVEKAEEVEEYDFEEEPSIDIPPYEKYGIPASTYYGDWAN